MKKTDPEQFLVNFSEIFSNAATAFSIQDIDKCEAAVQQANTLYKQSASFVEVLIKTRAEIYLIGSKFFLCILKFNQFSIEGRADKASDCFNESEKICRDGAEIISAFKIQSEQDEDFKIIFGSFFRILKIYLSGLKYIVEHELHTSNKGKASEGYQKAALKLQEINDVYYVPSPFLTTLTSMIRKHAELYERRADMLKIKEKNINYITTTGKKVFLIHGHDEQALRDVEKMLSNRLGIEAIILKDIANKGTAVIEKFEGHARECGYAIAILTKDDFVRNKNDNYLQARPNVLFELGWFCGRFGRDKVCLVKKTGTEIPSDLGGVICLEFENLVNEIEGSLEKELKVAGLLI